MRPPHFLALAACVLSAAGCIPRAQNDRLTIGRELALDAIRPTARPTQPGHDRPSLTGIVRDEWEPLVLVVPVDGTAHTPDYTRAVRLARRTARQRDESPTPETSLELVGASARAQQVEALLVPLGAARDLIVAAPRMVLRDRPWGTRFSPREAYQRHWQRRALAPAAADPFAAPPADEPVEGMGGMPAAPESR